MALDDDERSTEAVAEGRNDLHETVRFLSGGHAVQAQQENSGRDFATQEGELGEVLVVRQEDALLTGGTGENLWIGCGRVRVGRDGDVVTFGDQSIDQPPLEIFIGQEPHEAVARRGMSSSVLIAWRA